MRLPEHCFIRSEQGSTLISLLIGSLLMGVEALALSTLIAADTIQCVKVFTRSDSLSSARIALDKLGRMVGMARTLGDVQGRTMVATDPYASLPPGPLGDAFDGTIQDNNVDIGQVQAGTACNTSAKFPSIADYFYNSSTGTFYNSIGTWPWSSSMVGGAYRLSETTLITQVQCFDANGLPIVIAGLNNLPALDTYVFNVVRDYTRPGPTKWYQLQMAIFPAGGGVTNMPAGVSAGVPITLCSGIVGPINPATGEPMIFQYVRSADNSLHINFDNSTAQGDQNEQDLVLFKGVVVNLQVMNMDAVKKATVVTLRSELYLRNNSSATILGPG